MMDAPPPAPGFARFRAVPVMATFGVAEQRRLWTWSITRRYRPGEIIRVQGDPADHLLVLLSGRVAAAHLTSAGRIVALDEFVAPCALDKVAVIDGEGHTATLTATERCVVTAVPGRPFLAMVDSLPQARSHVFRALAAHARAQQARLLLAAMPGGRHRVAWWLTRQAPGPPAGPRPGLVRLPGGQSGLAHVLGLTRVTVNRALKALEREGAIRVAAHGIEISDLEGLARHLET